MNFSTVSQRRPRKSLLGTHKTKRESILPLLSDNLFSICEEKKESRDSIVSVVDIAPIIKITEPNSPPKIFNSQDENHEIDVSPVVPHEFENYHELCNTEVSNDRSPLRKRLDSLFSSLSQDDSFITHETMIANEDSILATTLKDTSPETDDRGVVESNTTDKVKKSTTNFNEENSKIISTSSKTFNICDTQNDESRAFEKLLKILNERMVEKNELVITCMKQMEDLQKKVDESKKEIEEMRETKQFVLNKLSLASTSDEKENTQPVNNTSNVNLLPPKSTLQATTISKTSSYKLVDEIRSSIKFMKTPRQSRVPRPSTLLTPHSMSFCIKSQYENLLE